MQPAVYRNYINPVNLLWMQKVTGVSVNPNHNISGIDLCDADFGIELKAKLLYGSYTKSWAVHAHQIVGFKQASPSKDLYWAFMHYKLSKSVLQIDDNKYGSGLESLVSEREVWFLPWGWIDQFPQSNVKTGPYVYVNPKNFPGVDYFENFSEDNGLLHVPKDSSLLGKVTRNFNCGKVYVLSG
jgi:hypothetical protein